MESVSIGDGLKWGEQCSEGMKTDPTMFLAWTAAELVMLVSKKLHRRSEQIGIC